MIRLIESLLLKRLTRNRARALGNVDAEQPRRLAAEFVATYRDVDALCQLAQSILNREISAELITSPDYQTFKANCNQAAIAPFERKHFQLGALDAEIDLIALLLAQYAAPTVLEVGVANGYSSAFLYYVLAQAAGGSILSIDLPRFSTSLTRRSDRARRWLAARGRITNSGTLGDLNPGGVVPVEKYAGWLVPPGLRLQVKNTTFYGNVFHVLDALPSVAVDFVVIDAMKGYDARRQLLQTLDDTYLQHDGICILDGYWINAALNDHCAKNGYQMFAAGRIGGYVKR